MQQMTLASCAFSETRSLAEALQRDSHGSARQATRFGVLLQGLCDLRRQGYQESPSIRLRDAQVLVRLVEIR